MSTTTRKKTVSFSQFSSWWTCPYKWYRDNVLKEKVFEDSIHMSFGTAIHETIQAYLTAYLNVSEEEANKIDQMGMFVAAFKREVTKKNLKYTPEKFAEFTEDGKAILAEFLSPAQVRYHFPRDKWELVGIEKKFILPLNGNVNLDARLDLVLREKLSGDIRIVDLKTATNAWTAYQKEDFTKISQLLLYKAAYSKAENIPLGKIHVEFIILKRKFYDDNKTNYEQTHIQVFKPSAFQDNILQVVKEFRHFVEYSFTPDGVHKSDARYPKIPGKNQGNCKYCIYGKNGKCDKVAEPPIEAAP
jgi:hypothetical protein